METHGIPPDYSSDIFPHITILKLPDRTFFPPGIVYLVPPAALDILFCGHGGGGGLLLFLPSAYVSLWSLYPQIMIVPLFLSLVSLCVGGVYCCLRFLGSILLMYLVWYLAVNFCHQYLVILHFFLYYYSFRSNIIFIYIRHGVFGPTIFGIAPHVNGCIIQATSNWKGLQLDMPLVSYLCHGMP